jgi:hypothetical protein
MFHNVLLGLLALLAACAGEVRESDGPVSTGDGGKPDAPATKLDQHPGETSPGLEGGPPPGPCDKYEQADTKSCAGGQACPTGLQPAKLGDKPCSCHVPCDPGQGQMCHPAECSRVCVQLTDSQGNPLPKQGVCVSDPGTGEGEPCTPSCKVGLICVAFSGQIAFCRKECQGAADCAGYKMVCAPLQSPKKNVCIPGGATVGPKEGESCAGQNDYCVQGLLCEPITAVCVKACDPNTGGCTAPKTCKKVFDPDHQVTLGYGCQ